MCAASPRRRKAFRPRLPVKSKYDIFQQIFKAEGPTSDTATLDPLGQVLQSLRQPWDRPPSSKYDVFQAIFALEGPDAQKPRSERQQGDSAQAKDSVKSKYDVFQALFSMEEPDTQRPALDPLSALQGNTASEPAESVKSKYDPFQALFNLQGPDARRPGSRPETPSQPTESVKSKYDPFQALFQSEGPSSDTAELDPFKNFLQRLQRPRQRTSSKYDVIQALMKVQGPSRQAASFDPFGAALRDSKQPRQTLRSKYDPFQALFESQMPDGKAAWDPLPHLIKAMTASSLLKKQQEQQQRQRPIRSSSPARSDKYNPVQQLLSAEPPTGRTPGFDPLGSLLKSPWVKEKRSRKQQTPSREGDSRDFVPVYASARPGSPSKWASQTPVRNQKFTPDQSGRAPAGEHEARDRAMADLQVQS